MDSDTHRLPRIPVSITNEQKEKLQYLSKRTGLSISELVRRGITFLFVRYEDVLKQK